LAERVLLGAVIGAHGTKGEVRVKTFTLAPDNLAAYGPLTTDDDRELSVIAVRSSKPGEAIVRFEGISERNAAEGLRGRQLSVARSALPDPEADEFYHADLIGLTVEDQAHARLGKVRAIHNFGAGDVMEIETPAGATEFFPFNSAVVVKVELPARIVVVPPRDDKT
jgi:16S rRNA processing protein RimM